ncbi:MAG TPA: septum formation initiator family protein [Candidatus Babeliales bacterium]|nr:septum formation initiator family protein [Candidatus Babeliales bacterium]
MVRVKKMFMKVLLVVEMAAFGHLYFFGNNGIKALQNQKVVVVDLEKNITQLNDEVIQLEQEMHVWQTDDFYKEKIAREQLQMARKGDELFYIGT